MSQPKQSFTSAPAPVHPAPKPAASTASAPAITSIAKSGSKVGKLQNQAAFQALVVGLQATYQPSDTFNIAGQTLTRDDVIALLNAFIATVEATKAARQQWLSAVEQEHNTFPGANTLRQNLRGILEARVGGKGVSGLIAFGFNPAKTPKRTVIDKATAVAKSAATRVARHTMGKVQKSAITGDVVGIHVTPMLALGSSLSPVTVDGSRLGRRR
jgi:hypothetical protein